MQYAPVESGASYPREVLVSYAADRARVIRSSRVPPPLWMFIFAASMWALNRYYPGLTVIPQTWRECARFVLIASAITPAVAFYQFHRAHTTFNPLRPETASALVTSGVFAWTRNPMYLGLFLLLLGWAVKLGTLSPFAGPLLFLPLIQYVQIRPEEQALRLRFGSDYDRYCRRVNRWWGRIRRS
jgi:protein-S-isoprenylcysteine O-methyltransferase Ste14